jgi:serine O-acetyltransferase
VVPVPQELAFRAQNCEGDEINNELRRSSSQKASPFDTFLSCFTFIALVSAMTISIDDHCNGNGSNQNEEEEELFQQLWDEAVEVKQQEPELAVLLGRTVLAPGVESFEDAVAATVCYRLLLQPCNINFRTASMALGGLPQPPSLIPSEPPTMFCPNSLRALIRDSMDSPQLEQGHTMAHAIRQDALAVVRRDPAVNSVLEVVLFSKGYAALVCHRAAFRLWTTRKFTALFLQSQASAVFGLDIHPLTQIGREIMLDHGTGVVMGETATVGDGCTILHGVTLGGTGKEHGDRHPKVGKNVLIGAGSSLLGNIKIGDGVKIGAGSVVLRDIPAHATAVGTYLKHTCCDGEQRAHTYTTFILIFPAGVPAKIIGRASESNPGSDVDETLQNVSLLHKSESSATVGTAATALSEDESSLSFDEDDDHQGPAVGQGSVCPYREYMRLAKLAPHGTVTICTLNRLLQPQGCTAAEIGACMFDLDTKNVGYIKIEVFKQRAVEVITDRTNLDEAKVATLLTSF